MSALALSSAAFSDFRPLHVACLVRLRESFFCMWTEYNSGDAASRSSFPYLAGCTGFGLQPPRHDRYERSVNTRVELLSRVDPEMLERGKRRQRLAVGAF